MISILFTSATDAAPSSDPLDTWHLRHPGPFIRAIAFGDGQFIARGYDTNALTSPDGVQWTSHNAGGTSFRAFASAYGNGRFVFTGYDGFAVTTNGVHWSYARPGGFFWGWKIIFVDGRFVAVGLAHESPVYDSAILTSADGLDWTQKAYYTNAILRGLAHGGGVFAAVGQVYSSPTPASFTATSTDAENWSTRSTPAAEMPLYITFGNGIFCGSGSGIFTGNIQSTGAIPAIEWSRAVEPTRWGRVDPFDTAFFAGTFLATGYLQTNGVAGSGFLATSSDGTNWIRRNPSLSPTIMTAGFGRDRFLLGGEGGIVQSDSLTPVPPLIVQPPADRILRVGGIYTNSIVAEGQPLALQWRVNGIDLPGATNATLVVTNAPENLSGAHTVVATSPGGASTSLVARVIITAPCSIELQPISQSTVEGGTATFSVRAIGTPPIAFRWRRNGTTVAYNFEDQNTSYLTLSNVLGGGTYSVVVSNWASYPGEISVPAYLIVQPDFDHDGLPDKYEMEHQFDPTNSFDATLDSDGDGLSNAAEYLAGTDPRDVTSYLRIDRIDAAQGATIYFNARAGNTYTIQYADQLTATDWQRLADAPAQTSSGELSVRDPVASLRRFYRLLTPRVP